MYIQEHISETFLLLILSKELFYKSFCWLAKSSGFKFFQFPWKFYEIMFSWHKVTDS